MAAPPPPPAQILKIGLEKPKRRPPGASNKIVERKGGDQNDRVKSKLKFAADWSAMAKSLENEVSVTLKSLRKRQGGERGMWTVMEVAGKGGKAKMKVKDLKLSAYMPNLLDPCAKKEEKNKEKYEILFDLCLDKDVELIRWASETEVHISTKSDVEYEAHFPSKWGCKTLREKLCSCVPKELHEVPTKAKGEESKTKLPFAPLPPPPS
eukprot:jgi/Bigna1/90211/estExt_fgenesh1_pg.C_650050